MAKSAINPKLLKGGLFRVDRDNGEVLTVVPFQYNPESISRSLTPRSGDGEGGGALRLSGPASETINLEIILDASEALEGASVDDVVATEGLGPQLARLEAMLYPSVAALQRSAEMAAQGLIEILPEPEPLTVLAAGRNRINPVRISEFSVVEELHDTKLNPIRVTLSLGFKVLSGDELGYHSRGGGIFMSYFRRKEQLAKLARGGALSNFGITEGDF